LSIGFENILLYNNLIIIRNYTYDEENVSDSFEGAEDQEGHLSHVGRPYPRGFTRKGIV
jgi:hypothetical protein